MLAGRVNPDSAILCLDIHRERRPRAPHACEPPSRQLRRLQTGCLPRSTHRRSPNPPAPPRTGPANLPIAGRNTLVLVSLGRIPPHRRPGSYPEFAPQYLAQSSPWLSFYVWRSLSRPPSSELLFSSPVSSGPSS